MTAGLQLYFYLSQNKTTALHPKCNLQQKASSSSPPQHTLICCFLSLYKCSMLCVSSIFKKKTHAHTHQLAVNSRCFYWTSIGSEAPAAMPSRASSKERASISCLSFMRSWLSIAGRPAQTRSKYL